MAALLLRLSVLHEQHGKLPQAIDPLRRLLALEPWREEMHRQLMKLLVRSGDRSAALRQFERCRQLLAEELDVEPSPDTIALYEQIRPAYQPTAPDWGAIVQICRLLHGMPLGLLLAAAWARLLSP
jgi:DNA-binding SARP family transcriptional activator